MKRPKDFISFFLLLGFMQILPAQLSTETSKASKNLLPSSFLIGEYEQAYDVLLEQYSKTLVSVCNNNNDKAFNIWATVLNDINDQSKISELDLNGVKLWLNIFFDNNGTIKHIVYYPKPNSKNMDFDKLTTFFSDFCKNYKMKLTISEKCMLSANASFPINVNK